MAGFVALIGTSESFQKCEHERKNAEPYKALHEKVGLPVKSVARFKLHLACTRATAAENDGAIAALSGVAVAVFTLALWISTDKLWRAGERQIAAANRQADLAERALIYAQRPWITVEVRVAGGMTCDPNGATFVFEYILTNVGNSPAMRVNPHPVLYSKTKPMPAEKQVLESYMSSMGDPTLDPMGFTISPNTKEVLRERQSISYDDLRATVESYKLHGRAPGFLPIYLVGVVTYRSALAPDRHETSFYYDLMKVSPDYPEIAVAISSRDTLIDANDLVLRRSLLFSPHMT